MTIEVNGQLVDIILFNMFFFPPFLEFHFCHQPGYGSDQHQAVDRHDRCREGK